MFVSQNINKNQTINILNTNLDTVIYLTLNNVWYKLFIFVNRKRISISYGFNLTVESSV
jgi:hypothetical protein